MYVLDDEQTARSPPKQIPKIQPQRTPQAKYIQSSNIYEQCMSQLELLECELAELSNHTDMALQLLRHVQLKDGDLEILATTKQDIQQLLSKQLRRQTAQTRKIEEHRIRQAITLDQLRKAIHTLQVQVPQLRSLTKKQQKRLEQLNTMQELQQQLQKHMQQGAFEKAKLAQSLRTAEEKILQQKQEFNEMNNQIFQLTELHQLALRQQEESKQASYLALEYNKLINKRKAIIKQTHQRMERYSQLNQSRIQQIRCLKENILKIDQRLEAVSTDIYQQKAFIRAGDAFKTEAQAYIADSPQDTKNIKRSGRPANVSRYLSEVSEGNSIYTDLYQGASRRSIHTTVTEGSEPNNRISRDSISHRKSLHKNINLPSIGSPAARLENKVSKRAILEPELQDYHYKGELWRTPKRVPIEMTALQNRSDIVVQEKQQLGGKVRYRRRKLPILPFTTTGDDELASVSENTDD